MSKINDDIKMRINGFQHYRDDLGDGLQSAVYFDNCRYRCNRFCAGRFIQDHPVGIDESEKEYYTADELIQYLLNEQKWCASKKLSILFSGGEPLDEPWFCFHVARALKDNGMGVIFRTCGSTYPHHLYIVKPYTDLYLFDLFTVIPSDHKKITGFPFNRVTDSLDLLERNRMPYRLRIHVLPGINDTAPTALASFCHSLEYVKSVILDFSATDFSDKDIKVFREEFLSRDIILY